MPTVVVVTDAFLTMAKLEAKALGRPDLRLLVLDHPLMNKDAATLDAIAQGFVEELMEAFTSGTGEPT